MKTLLIVDGNSILNRAFYGIRPLYTKDQFPTNAVYGFITILKKHLDTLKPDSLACAFDLRGPTFRHEMFDGYKANRHGMPEELAMQLPWAKKTAAAMGFHVITCEGYEADDIIGTLCTAADADGDTRAYVLTGDRDALQLITPACSVILAKTKEDIIYDEARFIGEYGIRPEQLVDVKALMGDTSDNIPGVAGIGEKTALKLIGATGSLDALYADASLGGAGKSAKEKLLAGKKNAYLSQKLAKICCSAPIETDIEALTWSGYNGGELTDIFTKLEFNALTKRFDFTTETVQDNNTAVEISTPEVVDCSFLCSLQGDIAVSVQENFLYAAAEGHLYKTSLCRDCASFFDTPHIYHDYKHICTLLAPLNIQPKCTFDTMTAAYLLAPGESAYPIEKLVVRYLSCQPVEAEYAKAWYALLLYPIMTAALEEAGMTSLLHTVEIPLSPVLAEMESWGFRLDTQGLHEYIGQLVQTQEVLCQRIYMQAGREFNPNSPRQLGEILFEELQLPAGRKTKTGYATDADTLSKLRPYHPIIGDILDYRQVTKLIGTYGENLIALADKNSRIHTKFNQTGTATGRLSSVDPNMQNIPVRGELGKELRRYFIAAPGYVLVDADYSQIELRLLAEISADPVMQQAFLNGADIHASTAAQVFHVNPELVTKEMRGQAKAVNFGIVYGIGDFSLAEDLHVSRKTAREYIDSYLATYVKVDAYLKGTIAKAQADGYTTTMLGRRRPIPELAAKNKNLQAFGKRVAMNSPIQGSAADIIKLAMIGVSKAIKEAGIDARLILQVHDELIVEARPDCAERAAEILRGEMEHAVQTVVPLSVDISIGDNWLDAK